MVTTFRSPHLRHGDPALERRLRGAVAGEVMFDAFSRGRYATDASLYQIEPLGVVCPRDVGDLEAALAVAREAGISVLPRGGGTSQAGQAIGRSLVLDTTRWLTGMDGLDLKAQTVWVEPGLVLDELNRRLKGMGLFYPVDVSTSSRATLGGMTANNSCGSRSLRYGVSVDNVLAIEALLADGRRVRFGDEAGPPPPQALVERIRAIAAREAARIAERFPKTARQVGGYALDRVSPDGPTNLASLLVGSEGTLACFTRIKLKLHRRPAHTVMGVCHFPGFRDAMAATRHLVELGPTCVELVDRSLLELARSIPAFAESLPRFVKGAPDCLLLVEFAGEDRESLLADLCRLDERMGELGLRQAVVQALEPRLQAEIAELRTAGLNIAMSMKGDGKPVSFIEDCAVPLEHLADYTAALDELFARHGTRGTWYAHAAVGCLHVRPILNLKLEQDVRTMRAIAEAAVDLVRRFKGTHSGEHGDGLVRSEWNERVFGPELMRAFEEVKDAFDPDGLFNAAPGKIVRAPRMDERGLFRFPPGYAAQAFAPALDWSAWGGMLGAAEMCNNNGACRKTAGGAMCPSFRVTRAETHLTRGRANVLRLALSGQLGPEALTSDAMREALDLCVSCKTCRRECPTGVDMARMKLEVQHQRARRHGLPLRDRLTAWLPRYAPMASRLPWLSRLQDRAPGLRERMLGLSARRPLPRWHPEPFRPPAHASGAGPEIVLFADTFTTWFEPENARAAVRLLAKAGYRVLHPKANGRPLCCGRTFLAAGLVEEARAELRRTVAALAPLLARGAALVGLEPACLLTFKDELGALLPDLPDARLVAERAQLIEELLVAERPTLDFRPWQGGEVLLHGHCHQKAFGLMPKVEEALRLVPGLKPRTVDSSCCGMAGAFGYAAEHHEVSLAMAELSLAPAVRAAPEDAIVVADGTSCRHQIRDTTGREARHVVRILEDAAA